MVNGWQWRDGDSEVAALADCHSISQADGPTLFTSNLQSSHQCFLDQIDISIHNCLCLSVILSMVEALYILQPYLAKFQSVTCPFVHLFDFLMFLFQCLESDAHCQTVTQFLHWWARKTAPQQGATSLVSFIALCFITQFSRLLANKPCIMLDISGYLYPGWIKHPLCGSRPAPNLEWRADTSWQVRPKYIKIHRPQTPSDRLRSWLC